MASFGRYDSLGPLGRHLLPLYLGRRLPVVAALAAYFDESGNDKSGVYSIAGYIGDVAMFDTWHATAWQYGVIEKAPHPISEFKASDCFGRREEFKGWTREEVDACFDAAVGITTQSCEREHIVGIGAAVHFNKEHMAEFEKLGFALCMFHALTHAIELAGTALHYEGELQLVFDRKPKFKKLTLEYFDLALENFAPKELLSRVSDPVFADSKKISVLQAADLLAFEVRKEAESRIDGIGRAPRRSLQRLVAERHHSAACISWGTVLEMARCSRAGLPTEHLSSDILFESGSPWRAPNQWPYRSNC